MTKTVLSLAITIAVCERSRSVLISDEQKDAGYNNTFQVSPGSRWITSEIPFDDLATQRSPWNNEEIRRRSGETAKTGTTIRSRRSLALLSVAKPIDYEWEKARDICIHEIAASLEKRRQENRRANLTMSLRNTFADTNVFNRGNWILLLPSPARRQSFYFFKYLFLRNDRGGRNVSQ